MQLEYVRVELDPKTKLILNQVINNYSNVAKNRYTRFGNFASFQKIYNSKSGFVASA